VSVYLPNVSVGSPRPVTDMPSPPTAFNAVVGLASRRRLTATRHVAELSQQPLPQWHVAAPDLLLGGKGGPGPRGRPRSTGPQGVGLPHVAAPNPRGDRPRAPCPCGYVEAPEHGVRCVDRDPSCQVQAVRPSPKGLGRGYRLPYALWVGHSSRRYPCPYVPTEAPGPTSGEE
jgi:hypothetical protein